MRFIYQIKNLLVTLISSYDVLWLCSFRTIQIEPIGLHVPLGHSFPICSVSESDTVFYERNLLVFKFVCVLLVY